MVRKWLSDNMFSNAPNAQNVVETIVSSLASHSETFSHSKHISAEELQALGLKITMLETMKKVAIDDCKDLQDCVLTIHHSYMHTFSSSAAAKIIESHTGNAMIINVANGGDIQ